MRSREPRSRRLVPLLVLACLTVIALDAGAGSHSPLNPVRSLVGNVVGPAEAVTATAVRPFTKVGDALTSSHAQRVRISTLETEISRLRAEVATQPVNRQRLAELDGLTRTVDETGYSLVAAHVVAMGPAQSFSRTATIDAGSTSGLRPDMTVLNNDGLVGRITQVTRGTATVLLIIDSSSVVGGRLGSNLEIGFLHGKGDLDGRLDLDLVDNSVMPSRGDAVVTWGSRDGVPYVAGIPIGQVESVYSSPRQSAKKAVIAPFVDFSALDVVGVVVPRGTKGDRPILSSATERSGR